MYTNNRPLAGTNGAPRTPIRDRKSNLAQAHARLAASHGCSKEDFAKRPLLLQHSASHFKDFGADATRKLLCDFVNHVHRLEDILHEGPLRCKP